MVKNIYIDGTKITSSQFIPISIKDSSTAQIGLSSYERGGRSGVALSSPLYRNFVISIDFMIIGASNADLITQRDTFIGYWKLKIDKNQDQKYVVGFEMSNGITKEIPAVVTRVSSDISPKNLSHSIVSVILRTELEYFTSSVTNTKNIYIYNGGGMPVPMPVPMDMSNPFNSNDLTVTNNGNAEYYPSIKVNGSFSGFILKNKTLNKSLNYSGTLSSSDYLSIDMYNRVALLNGTTNALANISGDWWWLQPGNNEILLITTNGDGNIDITYKDAYRGL